MVDKNEFRERENDEGLREALVKAWWDEEFDYTPEEGRQRSRDEHESDGWVDDYLDALRDQAQTALGVFAASPVQTEGEER